MKTNETIKFFIISTLTLCILYLVEKIISYELKNSTNNNIKLVDNNGNNMTDANITNVNEETEKFDVNEEVYNENETSIDKLYGFHNDANRNYYNEDNNDLSRIIGQVNKVFKYLNPEQRINLSKRKLDEQYLQEIKGQLNKITDETLNLNNKVHNVNTGILFDTIINTSNNNNIKIKHSIDEDGNSKCLDYNSSTKSLSVENCADVEFNFNAVEINNVKQYNDNIHPSFNFLKSNEDELPFAHNVIQVKCDDCDEENEKFKKCLTIVKNKTNSGYTTFVEECNGRTAQQFYK
jgi:hypothetical protein